MILLSVCSSYTQAPRLYIHIVSHNEPNDNIESSNFIFNRFKNNALQMASIIDLKNVKWNLQTSDGFVLGALQYQSAGNSTTDIFETLANPPYSDNIEIDPRSKNKGGRNIADLWYMLDSCGANPTYHLGGCIYTTKNPAVQPVDWLQYRNPIKGNIYGNLWQCSLITGAGSYPAHSNDLHDFGVFKPDTTTNFYQHNPAKNLWCMGTGCAPKLDSLDDEQAMIDLIQGQVDSIQNGLWPADKFYVTRIMTNQREYGPLFFQKMTKVIDSLNLIPSSTLQWATIGETFAAFQLWQTSTGLDHSQWLCGQATTPLEDVNPDESDFQVYPNPFHNMITIDSPDNQEHIIEIVNQLGCRVYSGVLNTNSTIDLSALSEGIYFLRIDNRTIELVRN